MCWDITLSKNIGPISPNSEVEILAPGVIVLGDGTFLITS